MSRGRGSHGSGGGFNNGSASSGRGYGGSGRGSGGGGRATGGGGGSGRGSGGGGRATGGGGDDHGGGGRGNNHGEGGNGRGNNYGDGFGGRGNNRGRARAPGMGRGRGRGANPAPMTVDALLAQESRRLMPVLHPERLNGAMWFGHDNAPRRAIVASIRRHFDGPWYNISSVPNQGIFQWWGDFIQSFYWDQAHGAEVYRLWFHVTGGRLRDMISKAKVSGNKPEWISDEIWDVMWEYWNTEEAKNRSRIASENRLSSRDGYGPHAHTAGARSYNQVRDLIRQKEGTEPSMLGILRETHKKSDGTYVDEKAKSIDEEVQRQLQASQESDDATDGGSNATELTQLDEDEMYLKVVQPNKGRIFGLGGQPSQFERGESLAAAIDRISLGRQVTELQKQLATVVEYMKQFMPEGAANNLRTTPPHTQGTGASETGPTHVFPTENNAEVDPPLPTNLNQEEPMDEDLNPEDNEGGGAW